MNECPHCHHRNKDGFEPLTTEQVAAVPAAWKLGQVGVRDVIARCKKCKKLVAIDQQTGTTVRVGLSEFV